MIPHFTAFIRGPSCPLSYRIHRLFSLESWYITLIQITECVLDWSHGRVNPIILIGWDHVAVARASGFKAPNWEPRTSCASLFGSEANGNSTISKRAEFSQHIYRYAGESLSNSWDGGMLASYVLVAWHISEYMGFSQRCSSCSLSPPSITWPILHWIKGGVHVTK